MKKKLYEDDRKPFVIEVDEETDLDLMCVLSDRYLPDNIKLVNTQIVPDCEMKSFPYPPLIKEIKVVKRVKLPQRSASSGLRGGINHVLTDFFQKTYSRLCFNLRSTVNCEIVGIWHNVTLMEDDSIELLVIAMVHYNNLRQLISTLPYNSIPTFNSLLPSTIPNGPTPMIPNYSYTFIADDFKSIPIEQSVPFSNRTINQPPPVSFSYSLDGNELSGNLPTLQNSISDWSTNSVSNFLSSDSMNETNFQKANYSTLSRSFSQRPSLQPITLEGTQIKLSSLCYIPGTKIVRYLGPLQLHFIKESWTVRGEGSLGTFLYLFLSEVDSATRAQVSSLGGNALLCHRIVPVESGSGVSRNQAYNMVSVYGDVVLTEPLTNHFNSTISDNNNQLNQNTIDKIQISIPSSIKETE